MGSIEAKSGSSDVKRTIGRKLRLELTMLSFHMLYSHKMMSQSPGHVQGFKYPGSLTSGLFLN